MDHRAPLTNVQAGDQVILRKRSGMQPYKLETVERTTRTQIILSSDRRFRRKDGMRLGGWHSTWDRDTIIAATGANLRELADLDKDRKAEEVRRELVRRCRDTKWSWLSAEQLGRIVAILDESQEAQ